MIPCRFLECCKYGFRYPTYTYPRTSKQGIDGSIHVSTRGTATGTGMGAGIGAMWGVSLKPEFLNPKLGLLGSWI